MLSFYNFENDLGYLRLELSGKALTQEITITFLASILTTVDKFNDQFEHSFSKFRRIFWSFPVLDSIL
jgi:hypothetical protein